MKREMAIIHSFVSFVNRIPKMAKTIMILESVWWIGKSESKFFASLVVGWIIKLGDNNNYKQNKKKVFPLHQQSRTMQKWKNDDQKTMKIVSFSPCVRSTKSNQYQQQQQQITYTNRIESKIVFLFVWFLQVKLCQSQYAIH